ncbi:mitochondrial carrier homolog 2-like [Limulus polyphemus]|uniref:Mitochondrial carrier homolog 2-like n=1 Tax=Limulus polyphemus TaxID=6850 RepID=A0ABM1AZS6_LIMPO|nr:mitochondrial carrier homolog 2-like [Limulus polyphemus]
MAPEVMVLRDQNIKWFEVLGKIGVTAAAHPFDYVKILIQIGHEPLPPYPSHTLFGKRALALPGAIRYIKYVSKVDGVWGLYRGLGPRICGNLVNGIIYTTISQRLPEFTTVNSSDEAEEELTEEQKILLHVRHTINEMVARCVAIVISQPFQVITVRTMAQFVGREEKYTGIFSSLRELYKEDGILGFFSGLIPRLIGEIVTLWLASSVTFVINTYLVEDKTVRTYIRASILYLSTAVAYPFSLVSNVMAVNNCGLAAGMPPNMPIYASWTDCWSHLKAISQLKRGSSILWRYYSGPYIIDEKGRPAYASRAQFNRPKSS